MRNFKKIMAVTLSAAMAAACFAGCGGSNGSTSSENVIKVGGSGPLTGTASSYGISVKQGTELAFEEINANGGVNGLTFEYTIVDDGAAADDAASAYDQLYDKGMQISTGSVTSGSCMAFAQRAAEDNVFFITPSASAADIIATGDNAFRICFGDPDQGTLSADYLTGLYSNIGCIYDTSDTYSSGVFEAFDAEMQELGVDYEVRTFDADNNKDFSAQVEGLKDCDVIYLPFYYTEAGLVARACAAKGLDNIDLFGVDGLDGIAAQIDDTVKNHISYITPFDVESTDEKVSAFVKAYKEKYDATPDQFAADGYDTAYAIAQALEAAGVNDASIKASDLCDLVVAAITSGDFEFEGVTGNITWDETGAPTKDLIIKEIQ